MSDVDKLEKICGKKIGFTFDEMPRRLKEILDDDRVTGACLAGKPPILEFFLPVNLLNLDLDQWQPPGEIKPLSTKYCLVVRAWERFGEPRWRPTGAAIGGNFNILSANERTVVTALGSPVVMASVALISTRGGGYSASVSYRTPPVLNGCWIAASAFCFGRAGRSSSLTRLPPRGRLPDRPSKACPSGCAYGGSDIGKKPGKTAGPLSLLWDGPQRLAQGSADPIPS